MSLFYFLHLLHRHLWQHPGRTLLALGVLGTASTLMLMLAMAGLAMQVRMGDYLVRLFPEERLRLEASRAQIGPIAVEGRAITPDVVQALQQRPDVDGVFPIEPARFPLRIEGNLFGQEISSDAVIHGVPRELIADALPPDQAWQVPADPATTPYPVVASRYFLDLYNLGLARSSGLPLLTPKAVIGRHFQLVAGESNVALFNASRPPRAVRCVLVGFSGDPSLMGIAMPPEAIRAFNQEFGNAAIPEYVQLVVRLQPGADPRRFLEAMEQRGLILSGGEVIGRRLKLAVRWAGWGLVTLAASLLGLGLLTFYMLFAMVFHARRLDLVRLRTLGVAPVQLLGLVLGEVGAPAVLAVGGAGLLNWTLMVILDRTVTPLVIQQGWLPPQLLTPAPGWLALCAFLILLVSLLPALPILRWVFTVEPAEVIRDL